jgi:hypothetical protein
MISCIAIVVGATLALAGCDAIICGEGTREKDGRCVAADNSASDATCGPGTMPVGGLCVPKFKERVCDPSTTEEDTDTMTGVITCRGTGGGGCGAPLACPTPMAGSGKQTICGQIYNFETHMPFASMGATGAACNPMMPTANGPCSLGIRAYDAIAFGTNPQTAMPLATDPVYIDDCGRYRVPNITVPSGPFIGLGLDDAAMAAAGPTGTTNTVGVATPKLVDMATNGLETFIAAKTTTDMWEASGGPAMSGGVYAMVFRAERAPSMMNKSGVAVRFMGNPIPLRDHYFMAAQVTRQTIDATAMVTGANGTALITGASVAESVAYSGDGTVLPAECRWSSHAGASLPNILFVQILRPINQVGMTCPL